MERLRASAFVFTLLALAFTILSTIDVIAYSLDFDNLSRVDPANVRTSLESVPSLDARWGMMLVGEQTGFAERKLAVERIIVERSNNAYTVIKVGVTVLIPMVILFLVLNRRVIKLRKAEVAAIAESCTPRSN